MRDVGSKGGEGSGFGWQDEKPDVTPEGSRREGVKEK
jgi:hypothetical protein